jgi:hypothetical protein
MSSKQTSGFPMDDAASKRIVLFDGNDPSRMATVAIENDANSDKTRQRRGCGETVIVTAGFQVTRRQEQMQKS